MPATKRRRPDNGVKVQVRFPKKLHKQVIDHLAPYGGNMASFLRLAALHELERAAKEGRTSHGPGVRD